MNFSKGILAEMSMSQASFLVVIAVIFVIALSALLLGKGIRWSQHGYWRRKEAKTKLPKPTQQAKGLHP